jgi:uncharacterized delta-60 repeat protein
MTDTTGSGWRHAPPMLAAKELKTRRSRARALSATTFGVLAASLLAITPAQAAPGDLDASFSGDGRQITDFGGGEGAGRVVVQGDGKILVAGGADGDIALARYNVAGSLDTTFSSDGMQTTDLGGNDGAWGVALQEDGKIVVAGSSVAAGSSDSDFALARYNVADGSLDESFGVGGEVITDLRGGSRDGATGVVIQGDGKIVVAGSSVAAGSSDSDFALARYNVADGSLDESFGVGGKVITDLGSGSDGAWGVAIQDGKIVVAGSSVAAGSSDSDFALARYSIDGSLDTTFSSDGKETTDFGGGDLSQDIAIQADGKIVAVGSSLPSVPTSDFGDFALARYNTNGSLDTSFSGDGEQTTSLDVEDYGWAVAIQADGRIVVAGRSAPDFTVAGPDFGLARYETNGSLDTSFSGDGKQTTDFGGTEAADWASGVAIQPDGNIVVAGTTSLGGVLNDIALARYYGGSAPSPPGGTPPTNSSPPTISGTAIEGEALRVNPPGAWSGSPEIQRTYQWRRCDSAGANCLDIASATATTYTLTAADLGRTIRVRETATNADGTGSADSAATTVVKAKLGAIAGTVRNARTGAGITGASVNCSSGYSVKTTGDGTYSIPNVAPAKYSCTAGANGYRPSTQTVTMTSGQTATANFTLRR